MTFRGTIGALEAGMVSDDLLARTRHVHTGGWFLQGAAAAITDILRRARAAGATTSLDPGADPDGGWDGGLRGLLPEIDHLLPNAAEARALTGLEDVEAAARGLAAAGATAVVKCGTDGVLAVVDGAVVRAPAVDVGGRGHDRRRRQHQRRLARRGAEGLAGRAGGAPGRRVRLALDPGAGAAPPPSPRSPRRSPCCDCLRRREPVDRPAVRGRASCAPGRCTARRCIAQVAGGKGLNAARAAATLGAEVRVVAILAGHAGRWLEHELGREGIPVESVWVDGESRSSLSVADRAGAGLTEFYEHGVAITADAWRRFAAAHSTLSRSAAWVTDLGIAAAGRPRRGLCRCSSSSAPSPPTPSRRARRPPTWSR